MIKEHIFWLEIIKLLTLSRERLDSWIDGLIVLISDGGSQLGLNLEKKPLIRVEQNGLTDQGVCAKSDRMIRSGLRLI